MSILCPVCGEPPVCDCRLDAMNRQLEAADELARALTKQYEYDINAEVAAALVNYKKVRNA